jgi:lipoprotein-releasing system permease protein
MKYEFLVGLRYLRSRRREKFISLITVISVLGVMIAVMTLNVVIAVFTGFEGLVRDQLLGFNAHVLLSKPGGYVTGYDRLIDEVENVKGVVAAAPTLYGQVILTSRNRVTGVLVRGIKPRETQKVVDLRKFMREGRLSDLEQHVRVTVDGRSLELPGIIIGESLAGELGLFEGDAVQVISPVGSPTAVGIIPRIRRFAVVGLYSSGRRDYDSTLVFMDLRDAQQFFDLGDVATNIQIRVTDVDAAKDVAARIEKRLGFPYLAEDWSQLFPKLFSALRLEKTVYFLVLLLMVLIAAFNIVSTLIMVVMEKRRDIAVLRSMGASQRSVRLIFLIKGWIIGGVGTLLGVLSGLAVSWLIQRYQFIEIPKEVFGTSTVPVTISAIYFVIVAAVSFLICVLAGIYPARQAAKLDPVEVLRYE